MSKVFEIQCPNCKEITELHEDLFMGEEEYFDECNCGYPLTVGIIYNENDQVEEVFVVDIL
jgi:uncharacterized Zn finger protein